MITPAACSASAAGMAWVVEIGPSTASTPSSMKRLAQATEPSTVLALSHTLSSIGMPLKVGFCRCAASTPSRLVLPSTAKRPDSSRFTPRRMESCAAAMPASNANTRSTAANLLVPYLRLFFADWPLLLCYGGRITRWVWLLFRGALSDAPRKSSPALSWLRNAYGGRRLVRGGHDSGGWGHCGGGRVECSGGGCSLSTERVPSVSRTTAPKSCSDAMPALRAAESTSSSVTRVACIEIGRAHV